MSLLKNIFSSFNRLFFGILLVGGALFLSACQLEYGDYDDAEFIPSEEEVASAEETVRQASAPSSTPGGGSEQFLWKPVSENDGRLVVLLPSSLRGRVTSCTLTSASAGTVSGNFAGDVHNGRRPHYRFSSPGAAYGNNITVRATLNDGTSQTWSVPDGAQRTTH